MLIFLYIFVFLVAIIFKVKYKISTKVIGFYILTSIVSITSLVSIPSYTSLLDIEILSGSVINKIKINSKFIENNQTVYTVEWKAKTTIGNITLDKVESLNPDIYDFKNSENYNNLQIGDPVSVEHPYVNIFKQSFDKLFTNNSKSLYENLIPNYPRVYDNYHIDRFISNDIKITNIEKYNQLIDNQLKLLGPAKEVNVIFVVVPTSDSDYYYEIQQKWLNGKKNDVIVILGSINYPKIEFVRVMSWTDDNFKNNLADKLMSYNLIDEEVINITMNEINEKFSRRKTHLLTNIDFSPPGWLLGILAILQLGYIFLLVKYFKN